MTDTAAPSPAATFSPSLTTPTAAAAAARGRLLWTDHMAPDAEAAERFYTAVTGWTLTTFATPEGAPRYRMWTAGATPVGGVMGLTEPEVAAGAPARWLPHFGTPDVDATYHDALALGARSIVPPTDIPTVGRFAILLDPEGAGFSAYQPANPPADPSAWNPKPPAPGEFSWMELRVPDAEGALAFYTRLFGWAPTESMPMGPGKTYQMFGLGGQTFGAIYPGEPAPWLLYVRVDDLARSLDAVRQGGGRVVREPTEIPGGDYIAQCVDPSGAAFALHGAAAQ